MKKVIVNYDSTRKVVPEETKPLLAEFENKDGIKDTIDKPEIRHELFELLDLDEKNEQSNGLSQLEFMILVSYYDKDNDDGKYASNFENTADFFKKCAKININNVSEEEFKTCAISNKPTSQLIYKNLLELSKYANETIEETVTCTDGLTAVGIENLFKSQNILLHSFEKADKHIDCGQKVTQADGKLTKKEFRRFMQFPAMKNMYFLTADKNYNGKIDNKEYKKLNLDKDAETFFKKYAGDDNQMDIKEFYDACFQQNFTDKILEANDKSRLTDGSGNDQHGDLAGDDQLSYKEIEKFVRRTT
eukprot:Mrub_05508.p1 GENE.Mrub_05508~~Mrub_05508.p1  ORF type:complete len:338 (-),score=69.30 Mrub_05508:108-1019(-)